MRIAPPWAVRFAATSTEGAYNTISPPSLTCNKLATAMFFFAAIRTAPSEAAVKESASSSTMPWRSAVTASDNPSASAMPGTGSPSSTLSTTGTSPRRITPLAASKIGRYWPTTSSRL